MTLTEQWKKGELPDGYYYCETTNKVEILRTWGDKYNQLLNNLDEVFIKEMSDCNILSEVPSYEEYLSLTYAKEEDEGVIAEYKSDCRTLAKLVLKLSPERKEWLEKHYGEYL
jgi:hypothetical protein